jgi:bifunctional DNase/RNase
MSDPVPMELIGVRIELPTNTPVLLMREAGGVRYLPIWIGTNEATSIALALEGIEPQRPLTHDLLRITIEAFEAAVARVVVTELRDGTFFADLVMQRNGEEITVSARPSDAVALAVRVEAPVFAAPEVLDEAGVEIQDEEEEEEIEKFREFLDDVRPEDFGVGPERS